MQLARFVTFVCTEEDVSNELHIFAAGAHFVAPYPLTCRLTIFSEVIRERMVVVEGVRLSEPNQILLEDLFPDLRNFQGVVHGLKVEISSHHPQVDLSETQIISDIRSKRHSVRFSPLGWGSRKGVESMILGGNVKAIPIFDRGIYRSSLIIANDARHQIMASDLGVKFCSKQETEEAEGLREILESVVPPLNCMAWDAPIGGGHLMISNRVPLGGCFLANWSTVTGRLISVGAL